MAVYNTCLSPAVKGMTAVEVCPYVSELFNQILAAGEKKTIG